MAEWKKNADEYKVAMSRRKKGGGKGADEAEDEGWAWLSNESAKITGCG